MFEQNRLRTHFSISLLYSFSVNFEKPDGPHNILLQPMYVSSSDNLNSSNKFINFSSNKLAVSNKKHNKLNNRYYYCDAIRNPSERSSSLNAITEKQLEYKRPLSLCSEAHYDMD